MSRWLIVRAAGRAIALPVTAVDGVVEVPPPIPVPAHGPAVRGVVPLRGRLVPLVHLAAAVGLGEPMPAASAVGVALRTNAGRFVVEVDDVTDLAMTAPVALPRGWQHGWATHAVRRAGEVVPVLDVDWVVEHLVHGAEGSATAR